MDLVEPSIDYAESYRSALREFEDAGISGFWKFFGSFEDPEAYVARIRQYSHKGKQPEDLVPASVFWLVDNGAFIGHVSIRHELSDGLRRIGGNIGYAIRPSMQKRGYGSELLKRALPLAKKLGVHKALVTCDADNHASRKIIEKNGGILAEEDVLDGVPVLRYWIEM
jgi:predicted acetyltransferase